MEIGCMKNCGNIYRRCREEAAKYNDALRSREGASELLGISVSSLSNYELGITKVIPPDVVVMMADLYNAPQLLNHYCKKECPLGHYQSISEEALGIDRVTVKLLKKLQARDLDRIKSVLLDIAEDGRVTNDEKPELKEVVEYLDELATTVSELKTIAQISLKDGE